MGGVVSNTLALYSTSVFDTQCMYAYSVMFSSRRQSVDQAFKNDRQLQQFVLTDVTATEKVLGTGSYGSVVEV